MKDNKNLKEELNKVKGCNCCHGEDNCNNHNEEHHSHEEHTPHVHGGKYIGEKKDGKAHGEGTYLYNDGSKYVGQWKEDMMHGEGIHTWISGEKIYWFMGK